MSIDADDMPISERTPELMAAVDAGVMAGDAILEVYQNGFNPVTKEDDSPVTEADLKSNEVVKRILSGTGHHVLSEEDMDDEGRLDEDTIWIVDPLDGTADFIDRTGEFTVMIALVRDSRPVLGVIGWPTGGELFVAQEGCGAFRHSAGGWGRISVTRASSLAECRVVGSRNHLSGEERSFIGGLGVRGFSSIGSSLKALRISSGDAEAYITTTDKMKEWDTAASNCIVAEAGGRMTDMLGNDLTYNNRNTRHRTGILATNGLVHDEIVRAFRQHAPSGT